MFCLAGTIRPTHCQDPNRDATVYLRAGKGRIMSLLTGYIHCFILRSCWSCILTMFCLTGTIRPTHSSKPTRHVTAHLRAGEGRIDGVLIGYVFCSLLNSCWSCVLTMFCLTGTMRPNHSSYPTKDDTMHLKAGK